MLRRNTAERCLLAALGWVVALSKGARCMRGSVHESCCVVCCFLFVYSCFCLSVVWLISLRIGRLAATRCLRRMARAGGMVMRFCGRRKPSSMRRRTSSSCFLASAASV